MLRNSILIKFKPINIFLSDTLLFKRYAVTKPSKIHDEKRKKKEIIQNNLGISYTRSATFIRKHDFLQTIENHRLLATLNSLHKMGILKEDIYNFPTILAIHSNSIEHNLSYLQEAGFTYVSAQVLLRFRNTVKKSVSLLKAHNVIPDDVNVPELLFSYLTPKPGSFPILEQFTDEDSIVYIHEVIFKHYLVWRLETTIEEVEYVYKTYDRFKYKSFEIISQMIYLLTKTLKYTNKKIMSNGYLLQMNPINVHEVMRLFPKLAGIDIKTVLFKYPKLVSVPPENIVSINNYLQTFGITDEAIGKCFDIFTLSPDSVLHRLNELQRFPDLAALIKSQRIVQLIFSQNKAKLRLKYLQKLKVKCVSINLLCASNSVFEKYAQDGNDRTHGFDIVHYIAQELNLEFKQVRQELTLNPYWCNVPLKTVQSTFLFLTKHRISKDEIGRHLIILIYPREKITEAFMEIDRNPDTMNLKLSSQDRLNLCLYFIERNHHFSGDGVWLNGADINVEPVPP